MQKWEYMTIEMSGDVVIRINGLRVSEIKSGPFSSPKGAKTQFPPLRKVLNQVGEDGWELVVYSQHEGFVLKRPKATDDSPPAGDSEATTK